MEFSALNKFAVRGLATNKFAIGRFYLEAILIPPGEHALRCMLVLVYVIFDTKQVCNQRSNR